MGYLELFDYVRSICEKHKKNINSGFLILILRASLHESL